MKSFFTPESIVIYGASAKEHKGGNHVLRNIMNHMTENIYLINLRAEKIYDYPCYRSIFDIPITEIDLAIIIIPVDYVLDALEDCLEFGVQAVIIESGALYIKGAQDQENKERIENIRRRLKHSNTRVMGPNSIGIFNGSHKGHGFITSLIYFDTLPNLRTKNLAVVSQTGLTLSGLLSAQNYIQELGISKVCAIGNKFDITESDVLSFLEFDEDTDAIALYLEDVKEGKLFREQCARISKKKPLILLKSGKTELGKKAIVSHTKSMAGNYRIIEALCKQYGIISVEDFNELFTIAKMILNQPIPQGNRLGIISISGAGTVISCDLAEKYGLTIPTITETQFEKLKTIFHEWAWEDVYNPLDIWSSVEYVGPDKAYGYAGEVLLEGGICDILIYLITGIKETEFDWEILNRLNKAHPTIPIYMGFFGGGKKLLLRWRETLEEQWKIPTFMSLHTLIRSISKLLVLKED